MKSLHEVNHQAIRVLTEQIGIVDTVRFVNQFTTGQGNYTQERDALFGHLTLEDIVTAIGNKRDTPAAEKPVDLPPTLPANQDRGASESTHRPAE